MPEVDYCPYCADEACDPRARTTAVSAAAPRRRTPMPEFTGVITEPGLYPDIPEDAYHADPVPGGSLSVTSSKLLLPPSCPARYAYARDHGGRHIKAMDAGTRAHALVLGKGSEHMELLDYPDYRTKKAQDDKKAAIAAGKIPTLPHELDEARAIADAVRADELAGALFAEGDAEQSLFWRDPQWDIWLRARMDWLTWFDGWPCIVDLKTTSDASPDEFAYSVGKYRYYMQDPHYRDGLGAVLGCDPDDIEFLFAAVETEPPHFVMVHRLDPGDAELGRACNQIAREIYRDCSESGLWPKWSASVNDLSLPYTARGRIKREIDDYHN